MNAPGCSLNHNHELSPAITQVFLLHAIAGRTPRPSVGNAIAKKPAQCLG
jgi:hypothetical protein